MGEVNLLYMEETYVIQWLESKEIAYYKMYVDDILIIYRGKQWQTTLKNLPRMQCARAIPVT